MGAFVDARFYYAFLASVLYRLRLYTAFLSLLYERSLTAPVYERVFLHLTFLIFFIIMGHLFFYMSYAFSRPLYRRAFFVPAPYCASTLSPLEVMFPTSSEKYASHVLRDGGFLELPVAIAFSCPCPPVPIVYSHHRLSVTAYQRPLPASPIPDMHLPSYAGAHRVIVFRGHACDTFVIRAHDLSGVRS